MWPIANHQFKRWLKSNVFVTGAHRDYVRMHAHRLKAYGVSALRGSGSRFLPRTKKLSAIDNCWRMGKVFSKRSLTGYINCTLRQAQSLRVVGQPKTSPMVVLKTFCLILLCLGVLFCFVLLVLFIFVF